MGLSCCAGIRAATSVLLRLCLAKKDRSGPTGVQKARRSVAVAARIALPVIVLNWIGTAAFALDATWLADPTSSDFNNPSNWMPTASPEDQPE